jgi:hypothetical protein
VGKYLSGKDRFDRRASWPAALKDQERSWKD